jgi:hypothetical protein
LQLTDAVGTLFDGQLPLERLVADVCFWLLATQSVIARDLKGRLWEVVQRSGVGLCHSGAVVDAAFWATCERMWAAVPVVQRFGGAVHCYFRFRDDAFIVMDDVEKFHGFLHGWRDRASPIFVIDLAQLPRACVDMLAATVGVSHGRFSYTTKRPMSRGPPLGLHSAHPRHTFVSWPFGCLRSMVNLHSSRSLASDAVQIFAARFRDAHADDEFVQLLKQKAARTLQAFDGHQASTARTTDQ